MTGSLPSRVEHVVVLMLENRSFDNLLGFLPHPDENFEGLAGAEAAFNERSDGTRVSATPDGVPHGVDPDHSHAAALEQLGAFGGVAANGGFVRNYERRVATFGEEAKWAAAADAGDVMRCLDPATHSPVLSRLALEFAVCQAWFCSVPGETWPNRNFAHAATSDGTVDIEVGFYYDRTIFEHLEKGGASWRVYYDGTPQVWCFRRLWRARTILDFLHRRPARIGRWYEMPAFFRHVAAGDLPSYAFVEPSHNRYFRDGHRARTNSQHPGNNKAGDADFKAGEQLVKDVYQSLLDRPELFARTLLVIVYDEHGGLYDHVHPDGVVAPGDPVFRGLFRRVGRHVRAWFDRRNRRPRNRSFDFRRLGARVPAVLVSPWIEPGTLVTKTLDHASIPSTLRALFVPESKPLTKRDREALPFHDVVLSPRREPRPNPRAGPPAEGSGVPLPDLDETSTVERIAADARPARAAPPPAGARADRAGPEEPPEPAPTELEDELHELEDRVRTTLERRPAVRLRRLGVRAADRVRRAAGRPAREAPAPAPAPAARGARPVEAPDVFAEAAAAARRGRAPR